MRFLAAALLAALTAMIGCGDEEPAPVSADLPTNLGELWSLCPEPDVPDGVDREQAADVRRKTEALIREVRRNPDDEVEFVSAGAHNGETYRDRVSVRELAREH